MEHSQPTAESIVKSANQGEYAVPEFQRGFVWSPVQVIALADSLARGFPVGSLLTWKSSTAIQRGDNAQSLKKSWIIDGQQRTTALCTLFGKRPDWWDYNRSVTWLEHLKAFDIRLDIKAEDLTFVTSKAPISRYVPVKNILESQNLYADASSLVASGHSFTGDIGVLAGRLQQVANIKHATLPTVEIDDTVELTDVAEIFRRLNSTGTRIKQADIYLGVVASRNPGWVSTEFLEFSDYLENQGFEVEPAYLFRTLTGIGARKSKFREVHDSFWSNINQNADWDLTKKSLRSVCEGLRQYGIINSDLVLSLNAVVATAVCRAKFLEGSFGPFLSWTLHSIRMGWGGPIETKLDRIFNIVDSANSKREALSRLTDLLTDLFDVPAEFTGDEFVDTSSNRNSLQRLMIYLLAYDNDAQDWNTHGYRIRAEAHGEYRPEWHHIFPRRWLKKQLPDLDVKLIDSVANLAVISGEANRKISAKSPQEYISELNLTSRGLLDQQEIPDPTFVKPEQYEAWLRKRAERLAEKANAYLATLRREA